MIGPEVRVTAFARYGREAASTRQRMLQYFPALGRAGFDVSYRPLLDDDYVQSLTTGKRFPWHRVATSYAHRLWDLVADTDSDIIWIYSELFPKLPSWFERLAFRTGRPVIYDFDDAFFTTYDDHPSRLLRGLLGGKIEPLVKGAAAVCCGNDHLRSYASQFNERCIVLPTVVDTTVYRPAGDRLSRPLTIGWIGSPSTWANMRPHLPVMEELFRSRGVRFRVIGAGTEADADRFDGMDFVKWAEETEVSELHMMDIGVMPLLDLPFQRGKSGYKLVQYMACGLPVVASPVGVNTKIVEHGSNGFLASTQEEWHASLTRLIDDHSLRCSMGMKGRDKVVREYSLESQAPRLIELFNSLVSSR